MSQPSDLDGGHSAAAASSQHAAGHHQAPAADELAFKRPTPSISTLLTTVPALHGKLPPLRSSIVAQPGSVEGASHAQQQHHHHHLQPITHLPGTPPRHIQQQPQEHERLKQQTQQQQLAPHHLEPLPTLLQQQGYQQEQQQQQQQLLHGPHVQQQSRPSGQQLLAASQAHQELQPAQELLLQQQPAQQPKRSWIDALQHPREFFLRIPQFRHSTASSAATTPSRQSLAQNQQQERAAPSSQQQDPPQQQELQKPQSWWQQRASRLSQRSSTTSLLQPGSTSASTSSDARGSSWPARRLRLLQFLDSPLASWVLIIMSLFVIFQEDFKYAVLPPTADLWFESITLALLITFVLEIALSCVVRPGFLFSFYFWLDSVAVLSLAFELPALRAVLLLGETQEYVNLNNSDNYLMAAGAQALVSSKAGRAAKVVRLFRQLQLIRLFKQLELRQRLKRVLAEGAVAPDGLTAAEAQVLSKYKHSESRVGQRLSDLTMKRVITGILAMLIVLPALEITSGINGSTASLSLGGLEMLHMQALTGGSNTSAFSTSLQAFQRNIVYMLAGQSTGGVLRLVLANTTYVSNPAYNNIGADKGPSGISSTKPTTREYRRYLEMQAAYFHSWLCPGSSSVAASAVTASQAGAATAAAAWAYPGYVVLDAAAAADAAVASVSSRAGAADAGVVLLEAGCLHTQSFILLDIKWSLQAQSVYGIARTLFLVCLLALGSYLIHSDTYRLVLQPVQRMVERVREMAEDPLMLAAVRNTPATSTASVSGGDAVKSEGFSARSSTVPEHPGIIKPKDGRASTASVGSSEGSKGTKTRFWPSIKVHAVADGLEPFTPPAGGFHSRASVQQQQMLLGGSPTMATAAAAGHALVPRMSGTQLVVAQARRLSAHLVAGVSAAGRAADRVRLQVLQRAAAIKQLLMVDESEQETSQGQYETRLLEQSIYKICALLAVGFGDAGAEVIAENIKKEGDLNPCMPGKKTVAVFGFCDIRRFTDTTEVLQEGVMEFVNVIAHLVHSAVAARGGAANKNIGDAFLLVWKLPKGLDDRDVSLLSSGGGGPAGTAGSTHAHAGPAAGSNKPMRTATLNWPGLAEEPEEGEAGSSSSSPRHELPSLPGATCSPRGSGSPDRLPALLGPKDSSSSGLTRPSSTGQLAADREISHMLQQQHAQLTIKRAASGIMDGMLPGGKRHSGGSTSSPLHPGSDTGGAGPGAAGSADGQVPEGSGLSSSGLRRAMLSIKSVTATPLSAAAKTSIINTIADNALASFVVIQVAITVSRVLKSYSTRADLNARMPGFSVQMGFGLHVGWAIEGAIGSEYKIDASYLSPNVNLASRLEAATKQYSVPMLLSRDFVDCLSPSVRAKVRQIDCVTVKGSNQPLGLFCYDLDLSAAQQELQALATAAANDTSSNAISSISTRLSTSAARGLLAAAAADPGVPQDSDTATAGGGGGGLPSVGRIRHSLAVLPDAASAARSSVVVSAGAQAWGGEEQGNTGPDPAELLLSQEYDDDWVENPVVCRSWALSWDFKEAFDEAFEDYAAGRWSAARESFESLLCARTTTEGQPVEDPPTWTLLAYMAAHDYTAPEGWVGVRELTEK